MLKNYLTIGLRNLLQRKVFTAINIVGLSLGFASFMLVMLYVNDETSFDRFHKNGPQLYRVVSEMAIAKRKNSRQGLPVGTTIKNEIPGIQNSIRGIKKNAIIKLNQEGINETIYYYDNDFFTVFSFPLLYGNAPTALNQPNAIVLTKEKAENYFGTDDVIGRELSLKTDSTFANFIITGVAENVPQNSSIQFDFILPIAKYEKAFTSKPSWTSFNVNTFLLLEPNVSPKQIESKFPDLVKKHTKHELVLSLQPMRDIHLDTSFTDMGATIKTSNPVYSYILMGIAVFILVISCINFINLSIGLSFKRAKEIGIRKVVGGVKKQLILQFISESFLVCFLAFIFSLLLVTLSLPLFNQLSNKQLSIVYLFDNYMMIIASVILLLITSLAAGCYPAFIVSRFNPVDILYSKLQLTAKNTFTKSLIVVQFCLTIFLITITFICQSQFDLLINKDLGYADKNIIRVKHPRDESLVPTVFKNELLKNTNIAEVVNRSGDLYIDGAHVDGKEIGTAISRIDENYLPALHIPIVKGRNFSKSFSTDSSNAVIVNESFAKEEGWKKPIGQKISLGDAKNITVVGVVKDYHFQSLHDKIMPLVLHLGLTSQALDESLIKIKPDDIPQTLAYIEKTFKELSVFEPFEYTFLEQANAAEYASEQKWKQIIVNATALSILISCLGIFALTSLSIVRRTKEIGIRKVLGASAGSITSIILKEFVILIVIAFILSIPFTWYSANRWLEGFAYRIDIKWWIFLIAGCTAIIIAMLTAGFQVIKASLANPVKSLRSE